VGKQHIFNLTLTEREHGQLKAVAELENTTMVGWLRKTIRNRWMESRSSARRMDITRRMQNRETYSGKD